MKNSIIKINTIDDYIAGFPLKIQEQLQTLRLIIAEAAPNAEEGISYDIPIFKLHGKLAHFAAYKNHIGFYPGASAVEAFKTALDDYETAKGTIHFPFNEAIPNELVTAIIQFKVKENLVKVALKSK
ncbi:MULTISPECIES: DUF1801 domain-containing protein [unclassified Arcicella]|uniref:iron chaperone n=1 Tax=unclassified Arcicella TaxID=2644986 RepID=UPI002864498C|nr:MULTISPECIES: DUF1801 domain-containing protein [unclassified Arcicella]MDR6564031.1 uncharacterized protein YdhG (YjbR/CyaY superfamily) [Arcicella sp. BE51]MDR6813784.1 uncharacterized protein YdhG (YjbR/CyaY superfamily) [Arcicella sp. BE140]MDR6825096.1 uncharacterized protein YdhG (YjbR/CyaY superfamily) [Arcicella sp. BE139]